MRECTREIFHSFQIFCFKPKQAVVQAFRKGDMPCAADRSGMRNGRWQKRKGLQLLFTEGRIQDHRRKAAGKVFQQLCNYLYLNLFFPISFIVQQQLPIAAHRRGQVHHPGVVIEQRLAQVCNADGRFFHQREGPMLVRFALGVLNFVQFLGRPGSQVPRIRLQNQYDFLFRHASALKICNTGQLRNMRSPGSL
ncbi:MAG: hypothetical protein NW241_02295 [Bacteroidia bacterium]|nr:hypothetical protein [Bacteroidia bacterium]